MLVLLRFEKKISQSWAKRILQLASNCPISSPESSLPVYCDKLDPLFPTNETFIIMTARQSRAQIWTLLLTEVNLKRHDCGRRRHACVIFFLFCTSGFSLLSLTTNTSRVVVVMVVPDKCMWQNTKTDSTNVNCKNETNLTGIPAVKFQIEALRYCNFRIDRFEQWYFQSFQKKLPWMVFEGSTSIHNE